MAYLEHREAEIDLGSIEQALRPVAIGRNNYLFAGSPRGGEARAVLYALIQSCTRLRIDPWAYLREVLDRISTHPAGRVEELTPRRWRGLWAQAQKDSPPRH